MNHSSSYPSAARSSRVAPALMSLLLLAGLAGCGGGSDDFMPDGRWSGTTSQGRNISFVVEQGLLISGTLGFAVSGAICSSEGTISSSVERVEDGTPIEDRAVAVQLYGSDVEASFQATFHSSTEASGSFTIQQRCGSVTGSWSASKP